MKTKIGRAKKLSSTLEKIAEIDIKLAELNMLREQLNKLASACQGNDRPDCPILDALSDKAISSPTKLLYPEIDFL